MLSLNESIDIERNILAYQKDPVSWLDWIGFDTHWSKQREVIESVRDNVRTACRSGHSVGKTKIASATSLWFLFNHYPSIVITTAPTGRQVSLLLWGEIRHLFLRYKIRMQKEYQISENMIGARLFETDYLEIEKGEWYAVGYSTDKPEAFTGAHKINILFVIDEGSGVKENIFEGVETSLNSPNSRVLTIGNPTDPGSYFGKIFLTAEGKDWNKIHIDCEESPNVVAGENIIPGLCNYDWPEQRAKKWGRNDPRFLIRVKGEFAEGAINSLISYNKAYSAFVKDLELYEDSDLVLAVDVAREGDDTTVILLREKSAREEEWEWEEDSSREEKRDESDMDNIAEEKGTEKEELEISEEREEIGAKIVKKIPKHRTMDAVAEIVLLVKKFPSIKEICIDMIGVGSGVYDRLIEMQESKEILELEGVLIFGVNVGEKASDSMAYLNLRSELADIVKKEIENERLLYDDEDLVDQLSQTKFRFHSRGAFALEPKEIFKKRYKRSPDEMDALMISFAPRVLKQRNPEPRIRVL